MKGQRFLVSGRVQGVFYRRFCQQHATQLGITGWARNLPDGGVEVHAFGEEQQLQHYATKLKKGPFAARVTQLIAEDIPHEDHAAFMIREG